MAELKTKLTEQPVAEYLSQIADETMRNDCFKICQMMEEIGKSPARMWGTSIVGIGNYTYSYKSGKTGEWFMMGFSPRKQNISLYIMGCDGENKQELLSRFGKHTAGKGCVYIKTIADINVDVLKEMCEVSYQKLKNS